jgi:hypothetical protein
MVVRRYLRYPLSGARVMELLAERAVDVSKRTVMRWVQTFGPLLAAEAANTAADRAANGTRSRALARGRASPRVSITLFSWPKRAPIVRG